MINVTSTQNHGAGLYIGGANTLVQGGNYINNGQIGIDGSNAPNSKVIGANISGNNYAQYNVAWDAGGIKVACEVGLLLSGNTVNNNNGQGIWADIESSNLTIIRNIVSNNTGNGIEYEISHGATSISENTVTDNGGSGIYISNSDGVTVSGNVVTVNPLNKFNTLGAAMGGGIDVINNGGRGNDPNGLPHLSINDTVQRNVIIHPGDSTQDGIWTYQALPAAPNIVFNNNTYYVPNSTGSFWHFGDWNYTWTAVQQAGIYETAGAMDVGNPPATSTISLRLSEDAWQGDAKFIARVNGKQIGAVNTVTTLHSSGVPEVFLLTGNWSAATDTVQISFINDAWGGTASTDRNLYVNSIAYNGTTVSGTTAVLMSNGSVSFQVGTGAPPAVGPADTLTLNLSEDAWKGDAKFTLTIDGRQICTPQTVTALHSAAALEAFVFTGNLGAGSHTIAVAFANDAYGGTQSTDRNLYVNGINVNGQNYGTGTVSLYSTNDTAKFTVVTSH